MKPGMAAQAGVIVGEIKNQLLVPRSAVGFEHEGTRVIKLEADGRRRPVAITVIGSGAEFFAIADNGELKEKDKILMRWQE